MTCGLGCDRRVVQVLTAVQTHLEAEAATKASALTVVAPGSLAIVDATREDVSIAELLDGLRETANEVCVCVNLGSTVPWFTSNRILRWLRDWQVATTSARLVRAIPETQAKVEETLAVAHKVLLAPRVRLPGDV